MKATLATQIGKVVLSEYNDKCSKAPIDETNLNNQGRHEKTFLGLKSWDEIDHFQDFVCEHCGQVFKMGIGTTKYDTPSGHLEIGCLFWSYDLPENYYWDNHKGPHLNAVLPNGHYWNIDSRASNCTLQQDRTHRCWVRTGEPPNVHVDKNGHTCDAGAGSIWSNQGQPDQWHGYLHNGEFHT